MFIHNICWKGNNVDIKKHTISGAVVYGALFGVALYILLWVCELGHAFIWGY